MKQNTHAGTGLSIYVSILISCIFCSFLLSLQDTKKQTSLAIYDDIYPWGHNNFKPIKP